MAKDTREHILEVSLMLFLQKSFKAVTMKEIVTKTGLSKGAFYHYFESKEKVFEEVVKYYFSNIMVNGDYEHYDKSSLKAFSNQIIEETFKKTDYFEKLNKSNKEYRDLNQYFLIFDAVTHIKSFRDDFNKHNQMELDAWTKIINHAKKTGEIKTKLSGKAIAKMYLFMGDGYGMHFILKKSNMAEMRKSMKEIKKLWDDFYQLLKNKEK